MFDEVPQPRDKRAEIVGGAALVLRFHNHAPDQLPAIVAPECDPSAIVRARLWRAATKAERPPDTTEARIRPGRDEAALGAFVIETTRIETAERMARTLAVLPEAAGASVGCFRLLCAIRNAPQGGG